MGREPMVTDGPTSKMDLGLERDVDHWEGQRGFLAATPRAPGRSFLAPFNVWRHPRVCLL